MRNSANYSPPLSGSLARKFVATSDKLVITPQNTLYGALGWAFHFAFKLDAGSLSTTLAANGDFGMLLSQWTNLAGTDDTILLHYADQANPLIVISPPSSGNFLSLMVTNGQAGTAYRYQQWVSQIDPFAGFEGDGNWHYFTLEWRQYGPGFSGETGYSILSIDGTTLSTGNWLQTVGQNINGMGSSTAPLAIGQMDAGPWPAMVGMSMSDIGLWRSDAQISSLNTFFTYSGTFNDIVNFGPVGMTNSGFPAQVIEPQLHADTEPTGVFPITGASPELDVFGNLTGTITGTSVVAGPPLFPAFATSPTLNNHGTSHTPGSIRLTLGWQGGAAPASSVTFTPSTPGGYSWSPSTITLTSSGSSTGSAVLTVPSGQTLGSTVHIDVTNNGDIVPVSVQFSVIQATAQVISAEMTPNGNVLWIRAGDLSNVPSPVTTADLSLSTLVKNGGSPIALTGIPGIFDSIDNWVWAFVGQPAADIRVSDQDAGCVKTGGGWAISNNTDQSALFQNYNPLWESQIGTSNVGKGSISYSPTHTDSAVYTITDLVVGQTYNLYRNSPDVYTQAGNSNAQMIYGTATTHANYAVYNGSSTVNYAIDQTAEGSFDDSNSFYRWTLIGQFTADATSATVTITNALSSGVLYANGIRAVLVQSQFMTGSDTVVLNVGDAAITTNAGTTGPLTLNVSLKTNADWFPFDPTLPRALVGYNSAGFRANNTGHPLANRAKYSGWGPYSGVTVDSNGQLTSNNTDGISSHAATMPALGGALGGILNGNGEDYWGNAADKPGTWILRFTVPIGGNPTVFFDVPAPWFVTSADTYGPGGTSGMSGDNGGAPIEFPITVTLSQPTNPQYTPQINLVCKGNGNPALDIIQNLWIGDPWTTHSTPSSQVNHPVRQTRLGGGNFPGGFLRHMNDLNIVANQCVEWSDQHPQTGLNYGGLIDSFTKTAVISSIVPVEATGAYANTDAYTLAATFSSFGLGAVLITTATPHGLTTGHQITIGLQGANGFYGGNFGSGGNPSTQYPDNRELIGLFIDNGGSGFTAAPTVTLSGGTFASAATATATISDGSLSGLTLIGGSGYTVAPTVSFSGGGGTGAAAHAELTSLDLAESQNAGSCIVLNSTQFVMTTHQNTTFSGIPPTLLNPVPLAGGETFVLADGTGNMPAGDCILQDAEAGINTWLPVPALSSDGWANSLGQYHAANTSPGHLILSELANEIWNRDYVHFALRQRASQTTYNWTQSGGATGANVPITAGEFPTYYGVWRQGQVNAQVAAGLTGIPEVRLTGGNYTTASTAYATVVGGAVTAITPYGKLTAVTVTAGGSGYTSAPTVTLSGGLGPGGIAGVPSATISGGAVTGFTWNFAAISASNPIGQNYTSAPTVAFSGGGGSGATATATWTINGTGYGTGGAAAPTVAILGGAGSGATATATVSGGAVTGYTVTAGGSGYTLSGRSQSDVVRHYGGFTFDARIALWTAQAIAQFNLPMDYYTGDGYRNNQPANSPDGAPTGNDIFGVWPQMSPDDHLDIFAGFTVQSGPITPGLAAKETLYSNGVGYPVKYAGYEAALQNYSLWTADGNIQPKQAHQMFNLDRNYAMTLAYAQWLWQAGYDMIEKYSIDANTMGLDAQWCDYYDDQVTAAATGNAGMVDITKLVSPAAQAWLDYVSTPTPTATKLIVTTQPPGSVGAGSSFGLVISAETSGNIVDSSYTANVTIAIGTNPGSGTLSGTVTIAAVSGVATFSGLSINNSGTGYTLTATSGSLTGTTTSTFDVMSLSPSPSATTILMLSQCLSGV